MDGPRPLVTAANNLASIDKFNFFASAAYAAIFSRRYFSNSASSIFL